MRKYPFDTASFERIRKGEYVYVDKTEYLHQLVSMGTFYFLARPRRFGKSLFLSTLAAYFEGKRELFKGLAIDRLQPDPWETHPILRLDMSGKSYTDTDSLVAKLEGVLDQWDEKYGLKTNKFPFDMRFQEIIRVLAQKEGKRVVVLVDEYDNPLASVIEKENLFQLYQEQLHGFYSVLKAAEDHIQFCMLTGVTRFGKVSVFSGLNNLRDISMENGFAGICGITKTELHNYFGEGIKELAEQEGWTEEQAYLELKEMYDGYHFSRCLLDIYNPYNVLNALAKRALGSYWCVSGIPTLLAKSLSHANFDLSKMIGRPVSQLKLENLGAYPTDPMALFYQTGYLTLKSYDARRNRYTVGYPNREVEQCLLSDILSYYVPGDNDVHSTIADLSDALENGNPQCFVDLLTVFWANVPSHLGNRVAKCENYYHTIIYCVVSLLGLDVSAEYNTSEGFIDLLIKTNDYIYIVELKVNGDALSAMLQIEEKHYEAPFLSDVRKLYKIGLGLSPSVEPSQALK